MGNCCGSGPRINELIEEKLNEIRRVFPTMSVAVLLQPDGELIASASPARDPMATGTGAGGGGGAGSHQKLSEDLINTIITFRKTATSFGATLQHADSNVIHVRGKSTLFSCYDIDKYVLAFYSSQDPGVSLVDAMAGANDESMVPIINDLRTLIAALGQAPSAKRARRR